MCLARNHICTYRLVGCVTRKVFRSKSCLSGFTTSRSSLNTKVIGCSSTLKEGGNIFCFLHARRCYFLILWSPFYAISNKGFTGKWPKKCKLCWHRIYHLGLEKNGDGFGAILFFIYPPAKGYLGTLLNRQSPTCLVHFDLWDINQGNHNGTSSTIVWSCHEHSTTWKYP